MATQKELLDRARASLLTEYERIMGPLATWSPDLVMEFDRVHRMTRYRTINAVAVLLAQTEKRKGMRLD